MAHFGSYNTSDPNTGQNPLLAAGSIPPITLTTDIEGALGYTVASDQSGTLTIAQSFDNVHFDYATTVAVTGGTGAGGSVSIVAPYLRVSYLNGATPQTYLRLFFRTFGTKTG